MLRLLDLRFADDIFFCPYSRDCWLFWIENVVMLSRSWAPTIYFFNERGSATIPFTHTGPTKTHIKTRLSRHGLAAYFAWGMMAGQSWMPTIKQYVNAICHWKTDYNFLMPSSPVWLFWSGSWLCSPGKFGSNRRCSPEVAAACCGPTWTCPSHDVLHSWNERARSWENWFLHGHRWFGYLRHI